MTKSRTPPETGRGVRRLTNSPDMPVARRCFWAQALGLSQVRNLVPQLAAPPADGLVHQALLGLLGVLGPALATFRLALLVDPLGDDDTRLQDEVFGVVVEVIELLVVWGAYIGV